MSCAEEGVPVGSSPEACWELLSPVNRIWLGGGGRLRSLGLPGPLLIGSSSLGLFLGPTVSQLVWGCVLAVGVPPLCLSGAARRALVALAWRALRVRQELLQAVCSWLQFAHCVFSIGHSRVLCASAHWPHLVSLPQWVEMWP